MEKIRLKILGILNSNEYIEINRESNIHRSGIYMLYIDDLFGKNILPFYIGKSKDIQRRFFEHLEKILLLNKLDSDYLNKIIIDDVTLKQFYSGYYLYIKIYKFMIENKKNLDDIKMILLEETEEEYLFEREEYFIDSFKAPYVGFNQFNSRTKRFTTIEERNEVINIEMKEIPKWLDYGYTKFNLDVVYTSYLGNLLQSEAEYLPYSDFYKDLVIFIEKYVVTIKELSYLINLTELRKKSIIKKINSINLKNKIINDNYSDFFQWGQINIRNFEKDFRTKDERKKVLASLMNDEYSNHLNINTFRESHVDSFKKFNLYEKDEKESIEKCEKYTQKIYNEMNKTYRRLKVKKSYNSFALKSLHEITNNFEKKMNTIQLFFVLGNNGNRKNSEPFILKIEMYIYIKDDECIQKEWYVKNESTMAIKNGLHYIESDLYYKGELSRNLFKIQPFKIIPDGYNNYISSNVEFRYGINDYSLKKIELVDFGTILNELELLVKEDIELWIKISEGPSTFKTAINQVFDFSYELEEKFKDNKILNDLRKKVPKNRQLVLKKQVKRKKSNRKPQKIKEISEEEMKIKKENQRNNRFEKYNDRVKMLSDNKIKVTDYQGSKENASYECKICCYKWSMRADKIKIRPYCPYCKKVI